MSDDTIFQPKYVNSWALVIGVNNYFAVPPLAYATQDAEAFAASLAARFGFPEDRITRLLDQDASRARILSCFLRYAEDDVGPDDRIVVFFAGHGHTRTGRRGEVGFLVPVDGNIDDLSSLVRWDDLTRNSELIAAKHVLFVMDACYGGLALTRTLAPGSTRFLKDMLQRYSRQVLTAGKADEVVADSGGPRPGHSIFTGHLLDALEGAVNPDGIVSANAVMAYVYDRVTRDAYSQQSPHYGFLDGDGDFIFLAPNLDALTSDQETDSDVLVQVPASSAPASEPSEEQAFTDRLKDYLSDSRYRIRLDDLVSTELRSVLHRLREEEFPLQTVSITVEDFAERIRRYERVVSRLVSIAILISRWGAEEHQPVLERVVSRLADSAEQRAGQAVWIGLRWYPIMLLMYSGGIAALSARNYSSLASLLTTRLGRWITGDASTEVIAPTVEGILQVEQARFFKNLPGHERNFVPRSEYVFKALQPGIEDLLFLGTSYEELFDRFEVFYALICADLRQRDLGYVWGPPGRFGWKQHRGYGRSPFDVVVEEAEQAGAEWAPLHAGLFGGSIDRFSEIAAAYREQLLKRGQWI